ncbi:LysM peptidoglycan-binding domain-containing protein [Fastidiosibacter lacustris]|uniref:LysM peptidoglycan-binding domain-containing protein n=1 Tax=Fastidiosibacter lacustris TaxID=2056695 RepID=UPI000E342A47|nr:LysM peptidoglycan-binding domain-containing protein [Fastidiosibacter lacustris]
MNKKLYLLLLGTFIIAGCAQRDIPRLPSQQMSEVVLKKHEPSQTTLMQIASDQAALADIEDSNARVEEVQTNAKQDSEIQLQNDEKISINQPVTYKVEIGDSLYSIARKNNISIVCLAKVNKINDPNRLAAGQTLTVPKASDC